MPGLVQRQRRVVHSTRTAEDCKRSAGPDALGMGLIDIADKVLGKLIEFRFVLINRVVVQLVERADQSAARVRSRGRYPPAAARRYRHHWSRLQIRSEHVPAKLNRLPSVNPNPSCELSCRCTSILLAMLLISWSRWS